MFSYELCVWILPIKIKASENEISNRWFYLFWSFIFKSYCMVTNIRGSAQFVIFKPLRYCFEETIGFDVKTSFSSRPVPRLIRWYKKPRDITKEFREKTIQFHGTFRGLKITNSSGITIIWLISHRNENIKPVKLIISIWMKRKKVTGNLI